MVPLESVYSEGVLFVVRKIRFIHSIRRKKNRWIQRWNYILNPITSGGDIATELSPRAYPGIWKVGKCTKTRYIQRIYAISAENACVRRGLFCAEKFRKFLTRAEPEQKAEFPVSCAQPTGKVMQTSGTNGKCTLRRCAVLAVTANQIPRTPNGEP